jgi:hypothetical protein
MNPVQIKLHTKQGDAYLSPATEILYGGAAGGGKSYLMRTTAISWAYEIPNLQIYLFRRNFPDLEKNHLYGPTGLLALLAPYINLGLVSYNASKHFFKFNFNGAMIHLCHLDNPKALLQYQGAEMGALLIDELTQLTNMEYRYLRARVRLGSLAEKIPATWQGRFPRILCSANPGGIGHQWVKQDFIDNAQPMEIRQMLPKDGGMKRQYIPARLTDNPTMEASYADKLEGLGSPEMVRAWLDGDWDIVAGAAFEKLSRLTHLVRPFKLPSHWTKFMVMDWGTAKPFSVGWYAVVEGGTVIKGHDGDPDKYLPDGALVRYREYYGWNGNPDEGCRKESYEVAREVLRIEREADEKMDYRIGDSAMWAQTDGPSPQERMYIETGGKFLMRQSEKDRAMNYQEVRARIAGQDKNPMLFVTSTCSQWWRTVPTLQLDELNPEKGPDSKMEDHCYDETGYACRSRPFRMTSGRRVEQEFERARKKAGLGGSKDPYRVRLV